MADEEVSEAVSLHSFSSESPAMPSAVRDSAATSSADEGDCLSNHPAFPETRPAQDELLAAEDEASSALPPQGIDPQGNSPTSHFLSLQSNENRGPMPVQEELSPKS